MKQINYSEFQTLATCERKWWYAYADHATEEKTFVGLQLGTLCHLWYGQWLLGNGATLPEVWTDDMASGGKRSAEQHEYALADFPTELVERAQWLAARFEEHYGSQPPSSWTVISVEEWMTRPLGEHELVGRCDGLVEIDGQLWLIELKSYSSRPGPLAYAQVSPQLGVYGLLAEETYGKRPFGIIYQGIYTYQWKPTAPTQQAVLDALPRTSPVLALSKTQQRDWAREAVAKHPGTQRPAAESFDQIEVDLGPEHYFTALSAITAAIERREALLPWNEKSTVPNVGQGCKGCGFRQRCWSEMGGVEEDEIEVEDEGEEPR